MIIHQVPGILPRLGVRSSPFNDGWHPYRASFLQRSSAVRDLTIKALGEGGAESIVLASKPGHLLWTSTASNPGTELNRRRQPLSVYGYPARSTTCRLRTAA